MDKISGLKAGLYARVSTGRQEKEETIESQTEEIKIRITSDNNILSPEHIFADNGWSGSILARPALDKLRDAIKAKEIDIVYVYDLGRLSRDFTNQLVLIKEIEEERGVKLISLHDINPENEEQGFVRNILGSFHAYERIKIAERFRRGKLYKVKNGVLINAQAPYGYDYIPKSVGREAGIIINKEEAKVVRMIYGWVGIERMSLTQVRKKLYEMGIKPKKARQDIWTNGPICRLLRNETYVTGLVYYNKGEAVEAIKPNNNTKYKRVKKTSRKLRPRTEWIPFTVPKIIEDEGLFDKVQQVLEYNKKYASKNRKYDYLLSGLVYCDCGTRRIGDGSSTHGHHYYRCAQRVHRYPLESTCKSRGVNASLLDGMLWIRLREFLSDPVALRSQAVRWVGVHNEQIGGNQTETAEIQKRIDEIAEEEIRYAKAYGSGALDFDQFTLLADELKNRKKVFISRIEKADQNHKVDKVLSTDEVDKLCAYAKEVLMEIGVEDRKDTIHDIIERVIINGSGEVEVRGCLPEFSQKLGQYAKSRNRGVTERGEVHAF